MQYILLKKQCLSLDMGQPP